jgi:hypothetical protein
MARIEPERVLGMAAWLCIVGWQAARLPSALSGGIGRSGAISGVGGEVPGCGFKPHPAG